MLKNTETIGGYKISTVMSALEKELVKHAYDISEIKPSSNIIFFRYSDGSGECPADFNVYVSPDGYASNKAAYIIMTLSDDSSYSRDSLHKGYAYCVQDAVEWFDDYVNKGVVNSTEVVKESEDHKSPAYALNLTRPIWQYFRNNPELGIDCYWKGASTILVANKGDEEIARVYYDENTDLVVLDDGIHKPYSFRVDEPSSNISDLIIKLSNGEGWHTVERKISYYSEGNKDGRCYAPAKHRSTFPSNEAFLSYKLGYKDACEGIYETDNKEFDQEIDTLKSQKSMDNLVDALNGLSPEQLDLLELGFGSGELADKMDTARMDIKAKDLHPTQNEIDVGKSLSYPISGNNPKQLETILDGGPVTINLPLVVYDYNGTYYIVDGHHRWSQVFLINPNCTLSCIVFKNSAGAHTQDPADMLRDFQGAIAVANDGEVPSSAVKPGMNIFDWSSDELRKYLDENIKDAMVDVYKEFYNSEITKGDIENVIIGNAGLMLRSNKPIKNAPSRAVMPQTDTGNNAGLKVAMRGMTDI